MGKGEHCKTCGSSKSRNIQGSGARAFVKEWINKDLDKYDIPLFRMDDEEDWEDEEEACEEE